MNRSIWLPDDLSTAARAAGLDVPEVCRQAIRARLDHQAADVDQQEAPGGAAVRLDRIEGQLRQLRNVLLLVLAVSVGLAMLMVTAEASE